MRAGLLGLALGHVPAKLPWPCPWVHAMLRWSSSCCAAFKRCCRSVNTHSGMFAPDCSRANLHFNVQTVSVNSTHGSRSGTLGQLLPNKLNSITERYNTSCFTCCQLWPAHRDGETGSTDDTIPAGSALAIKVKSTNKSTNKCTNKYIYIYMRNV